MSLKSKEKTMKKANLKRKVKELIRKSLNAKRVDRMVEHICNSGSVDWESAEENYRLPKQVVCAISKQLYADYTPLFDDRKSKKEIENIYRMMPSFLVYLK
jgi:hypothetical protein